MLAVGIVAGLAIALLAMAILALGTYERGYRDAFVRPRAWRAELVARHRAVTVRPLAGKAA